MSGHFGEYSRNRVWNRIPDIPCYLLVTLSRLPERRVDSILEKAFQDYLWSFFCLAVLLINYYDPETVSSFQTTLLQYIAILPSFSSLLLFVCLLIL